MAKTRIGSSMGYGHSSHVLKTSNLMQITKGFGQRERMGGCKLLNIAPSMKSLPPPQNHNSPNSIYPSQSTN